MVVFASSAGHDIYDVHLNSDMIDSDTSSFTSTQIIISAHVSTNLDVRSTRVTVPPVATLSDSICTTTYMWKIY